MNELMTFDNSQFGTIRAIEKDGEPWFVAADVCRALGLEQVTRAMDRLDDDERGLVKVTHPQSPTKTMDVNAVNEPGLYHLVLCSNKPEAKAFKRWITHEVIPSIRKTGTYGLPKDFPSALRALADETERHQQTQADLKKSQNREREMAQLVAMTLVGADTRKANYYDELVAKNLLTSIRETANLLKVQEKEFVRWMIAGKFLYRGRRDKLRPYANRIEEGLFELKETSDDGTGRARVQTLVTPKGRETFLRLMNKGVFSVLYKPINIMDYLSK